MIVDSYVRDSVIALAERAGAAILDVYVRDSRTDFGATTKGDKSPLTQADLRANEIIVDGLGGLTPQWPVLSEEAAEVPWEHRSHWRTYWLVDPLDGTKEFLARNGEFTVNIALIHDHEPVMGVVYGPVQNALYVGGKRLGSFKRSAGTLVRIQAATRSMDPPRVIGSRSHRNAMLDGCLQRLGRYELVSMGSSMKFCLLAEGKADLYPRFGPTSEWDTASGQAVVEGAGGVVVTATGAALRYNTKQDMVNPQFFVYADVKQHWLTRLGVVSN